jgi:hypothetical protein
MGGVFGDQVGWAVGGLVVGEAVGSIRAQWWVRKGDISEGHGSKMVKGIHEAGVRHMFVD